MPDSTLEALLEAWAAWIAGGTWRPCSCGSVEKFYRPERVLDDEDRKPVIRPFSLQELERVERAVVALPRPYALLVKGVWVQHWNPARAARCAKLQPAHLGAWPKHRGEAFRLLRQRLD